jgi:hypothetical protein
MKDDFDPTELLESLMKLKDKRVSREEILVIGHRFDLDDDFFLLFQKIGPEVFALKPVVVENLVELKTARLLDISGHIIPPSRFHEVRKDPLQFRKPTKPTRQNLKFLAKRRK